MGEDGRVDLGPCGPARRHGVAGRRGPDGVRFRNEHLARVDHRRQELQLLPAGPGPEPPGHSGPQAEVRRVADGIRAAQRLAHSEHDLWRARQCPQRDGQQSESAALCVDQLRSRRGVVLRRERLRVGRCLLQGRHGLPDLERHACHGSRHHRSGAVLLLGHRHLHRSHLRQAGGVRGESRSPTQARPTWTASRSPGSRCCGWDSACR